MENNKMNIHLNSSNIVTDHLNLRVLPKRVTKVCNLTAAYKYSEKI